ncbi:tetratricopeptide repeat protein [Fodinibius sp.]|uniref:tetratricopeptide repeat protein n=1 Tax=Fodinibius sp. TaxID=1872440 RepID=UPI003566DBD6
MKYSILIATSCILFAHACSSGGPSPEEFSDPSYQAISALGDTLYAPPLDPDTVSRLETELQTAEAHYRSRPDKADAILSYGRHTAYLGNYQKAVVIFSDGIEKHPGDARFYRHRGHRYITLREFDKAIEDLKRASELSYGSDEQSDSEGSPGNNNVSRSTMQANIWYHLGLAYYLTARYDEAQNAYEECLRHSSTDDMQAAASHWLYMTLRRAGKDDRAGNILEPITEDMNITDHKSHHQLLLVFKGIFKPDMLLAGVQNSNTLEHTTVGYGLGNWHLINGRKDRAHELFHKVYEGDQWHEPGYIAAEMDLKRLTDE